MKVQVQKNGKSVAQKRAAPLGNSQLVNINSPKKVYRSSSKPHQKLFPDEIPSTSGSKRHGSVASSSQKRAAPLANSQLVNSNSPKKVFRSSSDQHKKLFPDETPSTSRSKGHGSVAPSSQVLPKKKTETIWHMGNVCEHSLRQICKLDTKQPTPEDVKRWRTVEAICMRLKDIDVPGNIGRVQGPVSFDEIFDVLGLDEEGYERKETRMEPSSTENISLLIVLIYSWRINVNMHKSADLQDVYYGVQIAYFAIIGTQMSMILLSIVLIFGICRENPGLIVPWIIGYITFMALEAVAMVYSNVLRDHVNKQFDAMCKAEVAFFIARALINVLAMWGVLRFYNLVRSGITWRGPEAKTAIFAPMYKSVSAHKSHTYTYSKRSRRRHSIDSTSGGCCAIFDFDFEYDDDNDDDDDDDEAAFGDGLDTEDEVGYDYDDYYDYYDDDELTEQQQQQDDADCSMLGAPKTSKSRSKPRSALVKVKGQRSGRRHNNNIRSVLINKRHNKYKIARPQTQLEVINESERSAGSGSDENDSLLVAYDSSSSLTSV